MVELLIKNIHVVDPINNIDSINSIACENGQISEITSNQTNIQAKQVIDLDDSDLVAIPGLIDSHVHLGSIWGGYTGYNMLAKAGVTTCLDMAGPIDNIIDAIHTHGTGINIAMLEYASPPYSFKNSTPSDSEIDEFLNDRMSKGAFGIKLLGGHYPLTPDVSANLINKARNNDAYIAWHAGTTENGSNILGMKEAIEIAKGGFLHLAHINSYCRGNIMPEIEETQLAIELLEDNPEIFSESYLSPMNGTRLNCIDGRPSSNVTCTCIEKQGFPATEKGVGDCILAGKASVVLENGNISELVTGAEGHKLWLEAGTDIGGSFAANPPLPRIMLATSKRKNGKFTVDCISTDGGCIPRNVILPMGLSLVELGAMSLTELIIKTSYNPANLLRLDKKGSLAIGNDADITIFSKSRKEAVCTIANGKIIMYKGIVMGSGGKVITTERGKNYLEQQGIETIVTDSTRAITR